MITKDAIMLAVALGASSALVVVAGQPGTAPNLPYVMHGIDKHPGTNLDISNISGPSAVGTAVSAPIVLAQGRCFNGHCY